MSTGHQRSCLAFSGGETSALAALLLLHEGDHLSACHFYIDPKGRFPIPPGFSSPADREQMAKYASQNDIPLEFVDVTAQFEDRVLDATIHTRISAMRDQSYCLWVKEVLVPAWVRFAESKKATQLVSGHHAFLAKPLGSAKGVIERIPDTVRDDSAVLFALPPAWRGKLRLPIAELPELMIRKFKEEARLPELSNHQSVRRGSLYPPESWADSSWLKHYVSDEFLQPGSYQSIAQFIDKTHGGVFALQVGDSVEDDSGAEDSTQYILHLHQVNRSAIVGPKEYLQQSRFICTDGSFELDLDPLLPNSDFQVSTFDDPSKIVPANLTPFAHGYYALETGAPLTAVDQGQVLVFFNKNTPVGFAKVERVMHTAAAEIEKLTNR